MPFHEIDVTDVALEYVADQVRRRGLLFRCCKGRVQIDAGTVKTYVPRDANPEYVRQVPYGFWMERKEPTAWAAGIVQRFLKEETEHVVLFNSFYERWLADIDQALLAFVQAEDDAEVHPMVCGPRNELELPKLLAKSGSVRDVNCLLLDADADVMCGNKTIQADAFVGTIRGVRGIIVNAYDDEGYAVWWPAVT